VTTVAISTLGTNNYTEVLYRFQDGQEVRSSYPIHALVQRSGIKIDRTIVLLTDKAREKNWELMQLFLMDHAETAGEIRDVTIKDGANSTEIWEIFETVASEVPENADLYIDITHGLRHLPMLLVMAAAYLRVAKNVKIKSISYGAFELGKRQDNLIVECDVFDLLPFVTLFDWASATQMFQRTGNASQLAELLRQTGETLGDDAAKQINPVADQLDHITLALEVARPEEAMQAAAQLRVGLDESSARIQPYAKPFALLKGLLNRAFERISLPSERADSLGDRLHRQRDLIKWYLQRGRIALASILSREWLLSRFMQNTGMRDVDRQRTEMAKRLDDLGRNAPPMQTRIREVWRKFRAVRNEIAHAGQDKQPMTAVQIRQEVDKAVKELDRL
jgi:CRISPR-associated Csx2 family protein